MNHISLFSGIGGDTLAAQWAGFETVLFVEKDKFCQKVLNKHWPDVPIIGDIYDATKETITNAYIRGLEGSSAKRERTNNAIRNSRETRKEGEDTSRRSEEVSQETIPNTTCIYGKGSQEAETNKETRAKPRRPYDVQSREKRDTIQLPVTLITGGFPCQPVSVAGKQRGKEDDRWLWPEMLRVIKEIRPRWVVAENVAGLVRMGIDDCISDLENIGYTTEAYLIPACAVNAPHRRDRVFIVAHSIGLGWTEGTSKGIQQEVQEPKGQEFEHICKSISRTNDVSNSSSLRCKSGGSDRERRHILSNERIAKEDKQTGEGWECGTSEVSQDVADTNNAQTTRQRGYSRKVYGITESEGLDIRSGKEWWSVEPNVGRSLDGFSSWLDRFDFIIPHVLYLTYGKNKERRTREILSTLRSEVEAEVVRQRAGGQHGICEAEILFTYLCKFQETSDTLGDLSLEGAEIQERLLRGLQWYYQFTGSPYRPDSIEQFTREHTDSLQTLSRFLAHHSQAAWQAYRWSDALLNPWDSTWELGLQRVAHGIPSRVDRLKSLGNAIVPQQIYPILKGIASIEDWIRRL